ncbi:MAG: helix-turn-helix domain-containing protein [Mycobacteriales bacterium]
MSAATATRPLGRDELRSLRAAGVLHVSLKTAARAFGIGENTARELAHRGELPVRVFYLGRRARVPLADLAAALDPAALDPGA